MVARPPPPVPVTPVLYTQGHSCPRLLPEWVTAGEGAFPLLGWVSRMDLRTSGPTFLLCLHLVPLSVRPSSELSFCSVPAMGGRNEEPCACPQGPTPDGVSEGV